MWSDRETDRDCLGYTSYVTVLTEICTHADIAPLTLGIFGAWGSGKTSLMQMLKNNIEGLAPVNKDEKTLTLWFNAWRYEGKEEAQSALIHAILAKLAEDKTILEETKELFKRLKDGASIVKLAKFITKSAMTMTPDLPGLLDCFKDESEKLAKTMEGFDKDFADALKAARVARIVVFIDDLDRCSSAKVIETFETIKLFLNTPSCTFVIGADAKKIAESVGEVYRVADETPQKDYLEKIVQIPFSIPEQGLRDVSCYIGMLIIGRHLDDAGWKELLGARSRFYNSEGSISDVFREWTIERRVLFRGIDEVTKELANVLPYADNIGRGLRGNPRQIKRFLNILSVRRKLAEANALKVRPDLLIKITVLEYVWEGFFGDVVDTLDPETGHSDLIDTVLSTVAEGTQADSKLVSKAVSEPGLVDYLLLEPALSGQTDLNPYLFLAQTSLNRERLAAVQPIDEKARRLSQAIEGDDSLRSRTAAKQASLEDSTVASAIVRILCADLVAAREPVVAARILGGLLPICRRRPEFFAGTIKVLSQVNLSGDAVAISASTLINEAEKAGAEVAAELKERYLKQSPLAEALAGGSKNRKSRQAGNR